MNIFNRRKKMDPSLPPEVQAYSQAERRERMGIAWLVGIVSLIVTLVLAAGLFFGGRWVYRKIARKDKAVPVMTDSNDKGKTDAQKAEDKKKESDDSGDTEQSPVASPQPATSNPAPATQPATGDTLPNTGPDIDL